MIDVRAVWAPQILNYCELIADRRALLSAFSQSSDAMWTSVVSYDELISQIFDDLDAADMSKRLEGSGLPQFLSAPLRAFVEALYNFDQNVRGEWQPDLDVPAWTRVEVTAREALAAAVSWENT